MLKKIAKVLLIITILVVLTAVIFVVLHWQTNTVSNTIRTILNNTISDVAEIHYSSLSGDLFKEVQIADLHIRFHNGLSIEINRINVTYSLLSTVSGEYHFDAIYIDSIRLETSPVPSDEKENPANVPLTFQQLMLRTKAPDWYTAFIAKLLDLKFGNIEIQNGVFSNPAGNTTIENMYLKLNGYANPDGFDIDISRLSAIWREKNLRLQDFRAHFVGDADKLNINRLFTQLPESQVYATVDASFKEQAEFVISLDDVEINYPDIKNLVQAPEIDSASIAMDCHIIGPPDRFIVNANITGQVNQYKIDRFNINGKYDLGDVHIDRGNIVSGNNQISFRGKIATKNTSLNIHFKDLNIADIIEGSVQSNLNGSLSANLDKLTLNPLNGHGKLVLIQSTIDTVEIDSLRFALAAAESDLEILEPSFLRFGNEARFTVTGTVDRNYMSDLQLSTENLNLLTLSDAFNIDTFSGTVDANLFATGYILDPDLMGYLWIPHLQNDAIQLDSLILQVKIDNLLTSRQGDAYFSMTKSMFGPIIFKETHADIIFDSNIVYIDTLFFANGPNYIATRGELVTNQDTIELTLDKFRTFYEQYWIDNEGDIIIRYDPAELNVEQAIFVAPDQGRLEIRGYWDQELNDIQTGLLMRNMHIAPAEQFFKKEIDLSGVVEGDFEVYNLLDEPELDIQLKGENLKINNAPLGNVRCTFAYSDNQFYFDEFIMQYDSTSVNLDGDVVLQVGDSDSQKGIGLLEKSLADLKLTWSNINLEDYSPLLNLSRPLKGLVSGMFSLSGTMTDPHGQLFLKIDDFGYNKFYADSGYAFLRFDRQNIFLDSLLTDLNGTLIKASGKQMANLDLTNIDTNIVNMPLEANIIISDDSLEFIGFLTDQVERLHGPFHFQADIRGSPAKPRIENGQIHLEDGILELTRVKNPITDVYLDAEINGAIMTINEFSGYSEAEKDFIDRLIGFFDPVLQFFGFTSAPSGVMDGNGTINLADIAHPQIDLSFVMNKFYIDYFIENTKLILSTDDLKISGRDTLMVTGSMDLSGRYVPELEKLQKNIYLSRKDIKSEGRILGYDLKISMPGNFIISSSTFDFANNFQFEIMGDLRAIQRPGSNTLELGGNLDINSGKYGSWGQDFEIQSGQIVFSDPKVINPDIDILAEKASRGLVFELSIQGNLEKQVMDLQVRDENDQYLNYTMSDKITLLSLGATSDKLTSASLATAGEDVINTSVETAFSRGAESVTGLDKVSIDMKGSMVDLQSMKLNNGLREASLSLGKYIFSNLYLEYTSQMGGGTVPAPKLSWEPGNQIGVKYRINKNWSLNSNYSQTQRGNNMIQISLFWKKTF